MSARKSEGKAGIRKPGNRKADGNALAPPSSVRERLLDAAFSAFMEHGYAGASTLEIATRARVSKRELYAHFRNKEALFAAGIEASAPRIKNPVELPAIANREVLVEALKRYGVATLSGVTEPHVLAVFRLAIGEAAKSPELARGLNRFGRDPNRRVLHEILSQARSHKLIADGGMTELVEEFVGLLWGSLLTELLLGAAARPTSREINHRAERAAAAFLALRGMKAN